MGYRTFVSMKIALIGTGELAESFAKRYLHAGHVFLMAWLDSDTAGISSELKGYPNLHICSIEDAASLSDLIIIAAPSKQVREVSYWLGDVRSKVIIDASANIYAGSEEQVSTVCAIKAITGATHIVKVFTTRGYEKILASLFGHEDVQLIMVGESKKAKEIVKILSINLGVDKFVDLGGGDAISLFSEMTIAWRKIGAERRKAVPSVVYQNSKL